MPSKRIENFDEAKKKLYRDVFSAIDEDMNGFLSDREFKKFIISSGIQVSSWFNRFVVA